MARQINARFYVAEVGPQFAGQTGGQVTLRAVVRATDDNIEWSKYTPSGELRISVTQDAVFEMFGAHRGKDVAITMELLENPEA